MRVRLEGSKRELRARLSLKLHEGGAPLYVGERVIVVMPRTDRGYATAVHVAPPYAEIHGRCASAPALDRDH